MSTMDLNSTDSVCGIIFQLFMDTVWPFLSNQCSLESESCQMLLFLSFCIDMSSEMSNKQLSCVTQASK